MNRRPPGQPGEQIGAHQLDALAETVGRDVALRHRQGIGLTVAGIDLAPGNRNAARIARQPEPVHRSSDAPTPSGSQTTPSSPSAHQLADVGARHDHPLVDVECMPCTHASFVGTAPACVWRCAWRRYRQRAPLIGSAAHRARGRAVDRQVQRVQDQIRRLVEAPWPCRAIDQPRPLNRLWHSAASRARSAAPAPVPPAGPGLLPWYRAFALERSDDGLDPRLAQSRSKPGSNTGLGGTCAAVNSPMDGFCDKSRRN